MSLTPSIRHILGTGRPRVVVITPTIYTSSGATTFTATSVTEAGTPALVSSGVRVNQRVTSFKVIAGQPDKPVYAKITAIDDSTDTITVDSWIGGTPTDAQVITVDGYIADLPTPENLKESFAPDYLIHKLYRGRKDSIFYGWDYTCEIDYSTNVFGDVLILLKHHFTKEDNKRLILIPRNNNPEFQYNVIYNGAIELSKSRDGYKGFRLSFIGTELQPSLQMYGGYGTNYATNFGTCL
jgi:hypothetical protein